MVVSAITLLLSSKCCGNYLRAKTIQGRKLFAEIRYILVCEQYCDKALHLSLALSLLFYLFKGLWRNGRSTQNWRKIKIYVQKQSFVLCSQRPLYLYHFCLTRLGVPQKLPITVPSSQSEHHGPNVIYFVNSDEERRFMYRINQGHLTVFCIV